MLYDYISTLSYVINLYKVVEVGASINIFSNLIYFSNHVGLLVMSPLQSLIKRMRALNPFLRTLFLIL